MLLELCERYFAGTTLTLPKDADFRRRRCERVRSTTQRACSGASRRDASEAQYRRGGVVDYFGAEGAARTVALTRSKGAP
jgi:hypothetical protein